MGKSFPKRPLGVRLEDNPVLSYAARWEQEAANQTYPGGSPVVINAGFIEEAANPATSVLGFAIEAGHTNPVAGASLAKFLPAIGGLVFYGNLLNAAAANHSLVAADFGASYRIAKSATLLGVGKPGWYIEATGTSTACKVISFRADLIVPNEPKDRAEVGDVNARVGAIVLDSVRQWK
jgi:hypothetical protein